MRARRRSGRLTLRHRVKWWFLRRTPEWRRCVRIADTHDGPLNLSPGVAWTLRRARRR